MGTFGAAVGRGGGDGGGVMRTYDVQDIIDAEYNLEPLECRYCHSLEVVYHQYIGDAYCQECGRWRLEE